MGYSEAMEKAGATIHEFENFGSYQGDWWAKVTYEGKTGWAHGTFGSCSGCDAFEGEFGWCEDACEEHSYNPQEGCEACKAKKASYEQRLADFGKGYLEDLLTQEEAIKIASENLEWDMDAKEMVKFLEDNKIEEDNPVDIFKIQRALFPVGAPLLVYNEDRSIWFELPAELGAKLFPDSLTVKIYVKGYLKDKNLHVIETLTAWPEW